MIQYNSICADRPDVLNLSEAARFLGISDRHLRNKLKDVKIPYQRLGRRYIFSRKALERWLNGANMEDKS